ncbi:MAG: class II aldolase/adducin family protein, partial [Phycisphaerae bacterium]
MSPSNQTPTADASAEDMNTIVSLSRFYGSDPRFVLAGGGNTSMKDDTTLYVKASGYPLATISEDGFVAMERSAVAETLTSDFPDEPEQREEKYARMLREAKVDPFDARRPSVETVLHEIVPGKFVVHTHATVVNALCCCTPAGSLVDELFAGQVVYLPFVEPGITLSRAIAEKLNDYRRANDGRNPTAILLGNHGMFIGGDSAEEIHEKTGRIVDALAVRLAGAQTQAAFGEITKRDNAETRTLINTVAPALRGLLADDGKLKIVRFDDSDAAVSLACGANGKDAALIGPMTPDHIVYAGSFPLWFDPADKTDADSLVPDLRTAIDEYRNQRGCDPRVVVLGGVGVFAIGESYKTAENARALFINEIEVKAG